MAYCDLTRLLLSFMLVANVPLVQRCALANAGTVNNKPNILMIISDDMRPQLGVYAMDSDQMHTPHLDALATDENTVVFSNAYVQQAVCGPSRTSFLTGRRPDTTKLYDFYSYWRLVASNATSLPQHLKHYGYHTFSVGKVFHPLGPMTKSGHPDDSPYSWSAPAYHPPTQQYKMAPVCPALQFAQQDTTKTFMNLLCPVDVAAMPGGSLPDIQSVDYALELLQNLSESQRSTHASNSHTGAAPFFLAVGLHKPHIPFKFPKEYLRLYPLENISMPLYPTVPAGLPPVAYDTWDDVRSRNDVTAVQGLYNVSYPYGELPPAFVKMLRQHYYASVSYVDDQIGRLLEVVSRDTVVIVFGDHGWQLGERGEWAKYSVCDTATRVPLIVRTPSQARATSGARSPPAVRFSTALVEMVDLFPTVADLAGVPVPPLCPSVAPGVNTSVTVPSLCVEGTSFRGALTDPAHWAGKAAAFSQYPRPQDAPCNTSDLPHCNNITRMGYSIRTHEWRYTEWVSFRCVQDKEEVPIQAAANWDEVHGRELYNMSADASEAHNIALDPVMQGTVAQLSRQLRAGWRGAL
eukprot:m.177829 g.177829  ORF g.177829 m.177829 type:complete len:577 (-) comp18382_c0_seq1:317-2047(-)